MTSFSTLNPTTEQTIAQYRFSDWGGLKTELDKAQIAQTVWRETPIAQRASLWFAMEQALQEAKERCATLMTAEMGKPIAEAKSEIEKCAWVCRYFAEFTQEFLTKEHKPTDGRESYVRYDPLGTVLAIMPWNFPFWQLFRQAAPSMMAGNTVVLKHAPNVTGCALEIEALFSKAGFPQDVFKTVVFDHDLTDAVVAHPAISGVALTGSVGAGKIVAGIAGKHLKPSVMELGGSDPFIVLNDADLGEAVRVGVASRCLNAGQSCIAAKRFIIEDGVYDAFVERFTDAMKQVVSGDPTDPGSDIGPLARADLRTSLHTQVNATVELGARLTTGGVVPDGVGFFYPATVVADVDPNMPMATEETFGPAAAIVRARDVGHAMTIANDSDFGLGASIWTERDPHDLAPLIKAGAVFFNGMVKSDPRIPFGGIKHSGFGRELAREGMLEFVNQKTVWVR